MGDTAQNRGISVTLNRLEEQIKYYDSSAIKNQRYYKWIKVIEIVAAAWVPLTVGLSLNPWVSGILSIVVVLTEGIQQVFQFQAKWISYRSTCEGLRHEQYLYLAGAGPYTIAANPDILLAEKVESLVSVEHAKWVSNQEHTMKPKEP